MHRHFLEGGIFQQRRCPDRRLSRAGRLHQVQRTYSQSSAIHQWWRGSGGLKKSLFKAKFEEGAHLFKHSIHENKHFHTHSYSHLVASSFHLEIANHRLVIFVSLYFVLITFSSSRKSWKSQFYILAQFVALKTKKVVRSVLSSGKLCPCIPLPFARKMVFLFHFITFFRHRT